MGFVFYDTETTGTDTSFDQILQFAAIHTDVKFNELDRFGKRCRLLSHIVPSPGAMRVTGVRAAQLSDASLPSHYEMFCEVRKKLLSWSPALFLGYNSMRFDEHMLRQAFFKTLHPPYLTNTGNNTRSDVLRVIQAASLFAPGALCIPVNETGDQVFKLDQVAPLNGFAHNKAHDAMADVEATIFICRLVAERAPSVWSSFMRFGQRAAVADFVTSEPIFCLSDFYASKPYSWFVTTLGTDPKINSEFYVYDLAVPPEELLGLPREELAARLGYQPRPVRRLRSNACPMIVPVDEAPAICAGRELHEEELTRRADFIHKNHELKGALISAFHASKGEPAISPHVEQQLYDGFFSPEDEARMQRFHDTAWESRLEIVRSFNDLRLRRIGMRLMHSERPDLLPEAERARLNRLIALRMTEEGDPTAIPWLTLPRAIADLEEELLSLEGVVDAAFWQEHRDHLSNAIEAARRALAL